MVILTITPRKKRFIRDFFIKREPQRKFFNYEFPKEAKATNKQDYQVVELGLKAVRH